MDPEASDWLRVSNYSSNSCAVITKAGSLLGACQRQHTIIRNWWHTYYSGF